MRKVIKPSSRKVTASTEKGARLARKLTSDLQTVYNDLEDLYREDESLYDDLDLSSLDDEVGAALMFIKSR
jgi:hypothetical protein